MKPEEIQKLLGGYATGTLTPEEQQALFQAALDDQELFDALAKEQSLRDLLRDPAARAHVLAAVEERPRRWWQRGNRWILIGGLAAASLAVAVGVFATRPNRVAPRVLVAETKPPAAPAQADKVANMQMPKADLQASEALPPRTAARRAMPSQARDGGGSTDGALKRSASASPPAEAKSPVHSEPVAAPSTAVASTTTGSATSPSAAAPSAAVPSAAVPAAVPPPVPSPAAPRAAATPPAVPPAATETVAVTAAAPMMAVNGSVGGALSTQNARALFYAGAQAQAVARQAGSPAARFQLEERATALNSLAVANLGVKWIALRRQPDGLFSEVDSEQIKAGDVIKLRLVPNADGYLSVREGARPLVSDTPAVRLQPFETPEITSGTGTKELTVLLARQTQQAATRQAKNAALIRTAATDQLSQSDRSEHAVYEVRTGSNLFAPVLVRITLNFR